VVIVDEVTPEQPIFNLVWQLHSRAEIELDEDAATLTQPEGADGEKAKLYLRIREPHGQAFTITGATPDGPGGQNPNAGVQKLVVAFDEIRQPLRLMVVLSPNSDACSQIVLPPTIRRSVSQWGRSVRQ
jgi:hypothetical protein